MKQFRLPTEQGKEIIAYTAVLSDIEAQNLASEFMRSIYRDYEYLQQQCVANGDNIMKRWRKRTQAKRAAILLEVDSTMYPNQWCSGYFDDSFRLSALAMLASGQFDPDVTRGRERRPYRNACLLPYINVEALKEDPARFLNLLHNRAKYKPESWASYDNSLLNQQWDLGSFEIFYNANCIVMHGTDYGKMAKWEKKAAHAWDIVGFPRAILVLEAQQKLLSILRGIVDKLLNTNERVNTTMKSVTWTKSLEFGLKKSRAA